ncbi:MAG: ISXO2-like transposase domain protein [Actinobacteria bacterium ADurb.Bin346]|nr:MAG: ISXO2-like transposase domain protein [Actinobacteria bacterium ADurb.Bin346]
MKRLGKEETAMATGALTAVAALYQDTEFTETGSAIIAKNIKKTFTDLSLSCLHYIHYKEKFFSAASLMLNGATLKQISDSLNINIATAFAWRHKILDILKNRQDKKLSGIVEADDTFFAISDKGNKNLKRKAKKRGAKSYKRGISSEKVCVVVARDRNSNTISDIATIGRPSADNIDTLLGKSITASCVLLTDRHPSFSRFAKNKKIKYIALDLGKGRRTIKGIYHIQNVNSYHSRLKTWIKRFKGVATKYLSNYLHWFEFIDMNVKDKTAQAAQKTLILNACLPGMV